MDAGDGTTDDSLAPLILESLASNRNEDKLSPEDLAWVDSCIVKDPELLEQNWISLKKALLEVIDVGGEALDHSATGSYGPPGGNDIDMLSYTEEANTADLEGHGGNHAIVPAHGEVAEEVNDIPLKKEIGLLLQASEKDEVETYHRDPFRHTYKEEEKESEVVNLEPELDSTTDKTVLRTEDIFRVWDLDIPSEEADFAKQLNKALVGTSIQSVPSAVDDSWAWKDLEEESIDNLIAGLGDLALNDNSGRVW